MGIIKAIGAAISGSLADQWLEVIEAGEMGDQTVFTNGVKIRKGSNTKGTVDTVSNGSVIHDAGRRRQSGGLHGGRRLLYGQ